MIQNYTAISSSHCKCQTQIHLFPLSEVAALELDSHKQQNEQSCALFRTLLIFESGTSRTGFELDLQLYSTGLKPVPCVPDSLYIYIYPQLLCIFIHMCRVTYLMSYLDE